MENATKGLMIAGAILIAIVLIGIGVLLVGQAQGWIGNAQTTMDEFQIQAFNAKFESFQGNKKGVEVLSLLSKISTNNIQVDNEGNLSEQGVYVEFESEAKTNDGNDIYAFRPKVNSGRTYTITMSKSAKSGLIDTITIKTATTGN